MTKPYARKLELFEPPPWRMCSCDASPCRCDHTEIVNGSTIFDPDGRVIADLHNREDGDEVGDRINDLDPVVVRDLGRMFVLAPQMAELLVQADCLCKALPDDVLKRFGEAQAIGDAITDLMAELDPEGELVYT